MNYFDLKRLKKSIENQKLKVAKIRERNIGTSQISGMPGSGKVHNTVLETVTKLDIEEQFQKRLERQLEDYIKSIPDKYIQEMIDAKLNHNFSWTKIATIKGGNNTGDGIRMMCTRYKW